MNRPHQLLAILLVSCLALAFLAASSEARAARAPLTPAVPQVYYEQKVTSADGALGDNFGIAVAIDGTTAVVGADAATVNGKSSQGAAYVFVLSGSTWVQQAKLVASDGAAGDYFGVSVALSGDTALVGASGASIGNKAGQGAAYVFTRSGTTWTQQAKLTATKGAAGDDFGWSVALQTDTALVGADAASVGQLTSAGAAYIFTRSGSNWSQRLQLTAPDGAAGDNFGSSVALSSGTAVVGAPYKAGVYPNLYVGAAYVFTGSGASWSQQARLTASDGAEGDEFGWSVALSGDTALVGSVFSVIGANWSQGAAYVFTRSGAAWSQQAKLVAGDGASADWFGYAVALSLDTALVSAPSANQSQGAAYLFTRSGTTWTQQDRLSASDGAANDFYGAWVAYSSGTPLVGASGANIGANTSQGAAYFYGTTDVRSTLNVIKQVVNLSGGMAIASSFTLAVSGNAPSPASFPGSTTGTAVRLNAGSYSVSETGPGGYYASYSSDCSGSLAPGETKTCTVTNHDGAAHLKLVKAVVNDNGGTAQPSAWTLSALGSAPLSGPGGAEADVQPGVYSLSESAGPAGYSSSAWICVGGSQSASQVTLTAGQSATCTITNDDLAPKLHLRKVVINDNGGSAHATDWTLSASGPTSLSGKSPVDSGPTFAAGVYTLSETGPSGYTAGPWVCTGGSQSGDKITLSVGQSATCTITNTYTSSGQDHKIYIPIVAR